MMWQWVAIVAVASCLQRGSGMDAYHPRLAANEVNHFPVTTAVNHVTGLNGGYVCPGDFVRSGNSCYYLSATMATWQDAHFECKDRGAELARMEKRMEDKNMRLYLNRPELAFLERWIGGIYDWEAKQWVWGATAKTLGYQGFSRRKLNANNKWHCIVMDPAMMYRWAARSCVLRKHFICEKRLKVVPTSEEQPEALRRKNDKLRRQHNRRVKLFKQKRREQAARERAARGKSIGVH